MVRLGSSPSQGQLFGEDGSRTTRLMLYILLAVILMATDQRGRYVPKIRSYAESLIEPVYHVVEWPARVFMGLRTRLRSHRSLRKDNALLNDRILEMSGQLQRYDALIEENRRLRSLLDASQGQAFGFRFADLIQVDLDPFSHKVVIDRGRRNGVEIGQAVVSQNPLEKPFNEDIQHHKGNRRQNRAFDKRMRRIEPGALERPEVK